MSEATLKTIRMFQDIERGPVDIYLDFDNDRHHACKLEIGSTADNISLTLRLLASALAADPALNEEK